MSHPFFFGCSNYNTKQGVLSKTWLIQKMNRRRLVIGEVTYILRMLINRPSKRLCPSLFNLLRACVIKIGRNGAKC